MVLVQPLKLPIIVVQLLVLELPHSIFLVRLRLHRIICSYLDFQKWNGSKFFKHFSLLLCESFWGCCRIWSWILSCRSCLSNVWISFWSNNRNWIIISRKSLRISSFHSYKKRSYNCSSCRSSHRRNSWLWKWFTRFLLRVNMCSISPWE